jgi:hypothetical protein
MTASKKTAAARTAKVHHGKAGGTAKRVSLSAATASSAPFPGWPGPVRAQLPPRVSEGAGRVRGAPSPVRAQEAPGRALGEASSRSLGRLRTDLGVSRRIFARLLASSERALADWEAGKDPGEMATQRINEVRRLVAALAGVMEEGFVGTWLQEPNEAFSGLKPLEVIERGEIDRIWRMLFFLESGVPG